MQGTAGGQPAACPACQVKIRLKLQASCSRTTRTFLAGSTGSGAGAGLALPPLAPPLPPLLGGGSSSSSAGRSRDNSKAGSAGTNPPLPSRKAAQPGRFSCPTTLPRALTGRRDGHLALLLPQRKVLGAEGGLVAQQRNRVVL